MLIEETKLSGVERSLAFERRMEAILNANIGLTVIGPETRRKNTLEAWRRIKKKNIMDYRRRTGVAGRKTA